MDGVHSIAVPTFRNETLIPRMEVLAADCVIKQLQQDGTFKVASSDSADAVVEGTVVSVRRYGARSVRSDVLKQREYTVILAIRYGVRKKGSDDLIDSGLIAGTTSFFVSGNDVNQDERQALPLALSDAATRLVSHLTEGW